MQPTLAEWLVRGEKEPKSRKIPRARTMKRAKEERIYRARVKVWLLEHPWCEIWLARHGLTLSDVNEYGYASWNDDGREVLIRCPQATQCHHKNGRNGSQLLNEADWPAVSHGEHMWAHSNPREARRIGVLV